METGRLFCRVTLIRPAGQCCIRAIPIEAGEGKDINRHRGDRHHRSACESRQLHRNRNRLARRSRTLPMTTLLKCIGGTQGESCRSTTLVMRLQTRL